MVVLLRLNFNAETRSASSEADKQLKGKGII
jgi:hypothetical protein